MKSLPIQPNKRILSIDVIRGFALFGIFLVNMPTFQYPVIIAQMHAMSFEHSGLDRWINFMFDLFVEAKFFTIFSFLFGLGFYIFMTRAEEKGWNVNGLFTRRLLALVLFGLLHLVLLWYGDILLNYALAGFFLLMFYKARVRTLLIWISILAVLLVGVLLLNLLAVDLMEGSIREAQVGGAGKIEEAIQVYQEAGFSEWLAYRWSNEVVPVLLNMPLSILGVLFMFLLGLAAGKIGVFKHFSNHRRLVVTVWWITLAGSVPLLLMIMLLHFGIVDYGMLTDYAIDTFVVLSGYLLSLFYISSLLILLQKEAWQRVLKPFSFAGRMALTNYLMQTVIGVGLFTGLNYFGEMNLALGTLICIIVFPLQIGFSYYWLRKFRYGPMEWLWRTMTYGQLASRRKTEVS